MSLMPHQVKIVEELNLGMRYVVAKPRTGKTRPVIEFLKGGNKILVLTKKAAIGGWHSELEAMGVEGWTVTNYEQVRSKNWDMTKRWDGLVLDEAHSLGKYPKPNLTVPIIEKMLVNGPRIGVSATPCAESYSQLFHQAKALRANIFGDYASFYKWHKVYGIADKVRTAYGERETYKKVKDVIFDTFKRMSVVIDRQEAMVNFVEAKDHIVKLRDDDVSFLCKKLKKDKIVTMYGLDIVAETPLAVAQKCQQICAGVVLDDEGEKIFLHQLKADWAFEKFKDSRIAVLTGFKGEVDIFKRLPVSQTDDFQAFQRGEFQWFVGSWQRFARGVDLSSAEACIITSCPWSSEGLIQGRDRMLRKDRTIGAPVYFPVIEGGIDEKIYQIVAGEKRDFTAKQYL